MQTKKSPYIAKAGEHRFVSELLIRGIKPMFSIIDNGIDVVLLNGARIQVKSSYRRPTGQYTWKYQQWRWSAETLSYSQKRVSPDAVDFYALWAVDDDEWYIVPSAVAQNNSVFWKNKSSASLIDPYKERWELLEELSESTSLQDGGSASDAAEVSETSS